MCHIIELCKNLEYFFGPLYFYQNFIKYKMIFNYIYYGNITDQYDESK